MAETPDQKMSQKPSVSDLLHTILLSLQENKAQDVVSIDLSGRTAFADFMVIASGGSTRQVTGLAQNLISKLKESYNLVVRIEGLDQADWVLIDGGDVIVHIFRPEVREFYQLEKMWSPEQGA